MEYTLIILCGIIPLIVRRMLWVRILCIIVIGLFIVDYDISRGLSARLTLSKKFNETNIQPSDDFLDGVNKHQEMIDTFHPQALLIFASLMILAAFPVKKKKEANKRVDLTVKTPVESGKAQGTAGHP